MVSAWAEKNRTVPGQTKVDEKSNKITAIPKLLELLVLKGCIVTVEAMGCQKDIASGIIDKEADYLPALKGNQEICLNRWRMLSVSFPFVIPAKSRIVDMAEWKHADVGLWMIFP
jgi:hypothetical protein